MTRRTVVRGGRVALDIAEALDYAAEDLDYRVRQWPEEFDDPDRVTRKAERWRRVAASFLLPETSPGPAPAGRTAPLPGE